MGSIRTGSLAAALLWALLPSVAGAGVLVVTHGTDDGCALPTEARTANPGLEAAFPALRDYDQLGGDRFLPASFSFALAGASVLSATIEFRARPAPVVGATSNDSLNLGFFDVATPVQVPGTPISTTTLTAIAGATWNATNFPDCVPLYTRSVVRTAGGATVGDQLLDAIETLGRLDVWIQDDTVVDFIRVTLITGFDVEWVDVPGSNNPCEVQPPGCLGTVTYDYQIAKYEVTNQQYAAFLNAKASASDPHGLWTAFMGSFGGITRSSGPPYTYSVVAGMGNRPVVFVSFFDAIRYANWLANGQGSGDTETGSYTLSNGITVTRNPGATVFIPTDNEWYKAAYYNAATTSYFDYPAGSDTPTSCVSPPGAANSANCGGTLPNSTAVGSYTLSPSPYGTFDQGGNVREWIEDLFGTNRKLRGGSFFIAGTALAASHPGDFPTASTFDNDNIGFRVARIAPAAPEVPIGPGAGVATLLLLGAVGVARLRARS
jgi:formylglycine-generating enzyme required for sulfatase activity